MEKGGTLKGDIIVRIRRKPNDCPMEAIYTRYHHRKIIEMNLLLKNNSKHIFNVAAFTTACDLCKTRRCIAKVFRRGNNVKLPSDPTSQILMAVDVVGSGARSYLRKEFL
jgi:hypothetical protein